MAIVIKEVQTLSDRKNFVCFPFELYKNNKYWVPPIIKDEIKSIDPTINPAFNFCKAKFWLAIKNDKIVGRIGAIINEKYNNKIGQNTCRFTRFEIIDDIEVSEKLIITAEDWAKSQGMNIMVGPLGFTNLDHQGLLIEGFEYLPSVASEYHLPYYAYHIERLGYIKEIDWVEFRLTVEAIPEKAIRLAELVKERYKLKVINFEQKKDLLKYSKKVFQLLNKAFSELYSVVELDEKMVNYYIDRYFKILNPRFVKIVETEEGEIAGFIIGLPSLSEAMQKARGKLLPFGFLHIIKALNKPKVVDLLLTAVDPTLQGQGVSAILINELQKTLLKYNVKFAETTGILENNHKAIQHWKNYNNIQHKRKRCYRKVLF